MKDLLNKFYSGKISSRQLITLIKNNKDYTEQLISTTPKIITDDLTERIYCIINNLIEKPKCPYCNNPRKWTGRFKEGYKTTCCSKECESKRISEQKQGQTLISSNRDAAFIEWQNSVTEIDDELVKNNIKYDKFIPLITNPIILDYLNNRFKDSASIEETLKRIELGIEEKPKCSVCGNPVVFVGRKKRLFTTYCCESCAARSETTIQKHKDTLLKNWGNECCYSSEKYKQMVKEKYGVEYIAQRPDIKEKRRDTLIKKYGTDILYDIPGVRDKVAQTNLEKYGHTCILAVLEVKAKAYEKYKDNAKYGTSQQEDDIYNWLLELGYNVDRHHRDEIFPFNVDFYLSDYDLYLEYHGSQYHNKRAYLGTKEDLDEIEWLKQKDAERHKETGEETQYQGIINTWTKWDVTKRNHAITNKLNYLEIYICKSKEELAFQLGFYLKCKAGKSLFNIDNNDLALEYLKYKTLKFDDKLNKLTTDILTIKQFQCTEFYKKQMDLFANDILLRRRLIQNRCKYLNKKENKLTANDIISGFKRSGLYYGYSHFNPQWTNWFIQKYNIETIYDPCGGWGHHLLGMLNCVKIIYNDLNDKVIPGIENIKKCYNLDNLEIHNQDATEFKPEDVDAFFMCPPYYNIEKYGDSGFKSLDDYKEFLNKIFEIWKQNKAKIFGLVIREDFVDLIDYKNIIEKREIPMGRSHFIKGEKKNKEYFYIFAK